MKVALAQINTVVGDVWGNVEKASDVLRRAVDGGADLVAFPELATTGYPPEDLLLRPSFIRDNLDALEEFAGRVPEGVAAAIGFVDLNGDLYNSCAVISGGEILHRYHKRYLPNYGVFDENRYFREGSGAPIFKLGDAFLGLSVCEDIWYPGGPPREQALGGAGVLLNVSASPYHRLKGVSRERMLAVRASDYGCYVVFCNLVGGQDELVFDGRSVVFDPDGSVVARAKQFEEDLLFVDIHPEDALVHRLHDPRPRKEDPAQLPEVIEVPDAEPETSVAATGEDGSNGKAGGANAEPRIEPQLSEEGEVLEALVLGLGDYFRKNGFSRAVLGLSGGIDSSFGAAVAARALGSENVTGVLMPSRYTSEESNTDAHALYDAWGDVIGGFGSYPVLGNPHYHQPHDVLETIDQTLVTETTRANVASVMLLASSPSRVGGLTATRDGETLTVRWTASPERDVQRYRVAHGPAADPLRTTTTVTAAEARLPRVPAGHVVSVKAVNARGLEGWDWARTTAP